MQTAPPSTPTPSAAPLAVPAACIDDLPTETLIQIADQVYAGGPQDGARQPQSVLQQLLDLSSLNARWHKACEDAVKAARNSVDIEEQPAGTALAAALRRLRKVAAGLQAPSWRTLAQRVSAMDREALKKTTRRYLARWPVQPPPRSRIRGWSLQRDRHLAAFAAIAIDRDSRLLETFMRLLPESGPHMPRLVSTLIDRIIVKKRSARIAGMLHRLVDSLPAYCQPSFQAVRTCLRNGEAARCPLPKKLERVTQAPAWLQARLLPPLADRIEVPARADKRFSAPLLRSLIQAIRALPERHGVRVLTEVAAAGWEDLRCALLLQCLRKLPEDPARAAAHLKRSLAIFDPQARLNGNDAVLALTRVLAYATRQLGRHGLPVVLLLLRLLSERLEGVQAQHRHGLIVMCKDYAAGLPPAASGLLSILACGLLPPHGETRLGVFRHQLLWLSAQERWLATDVFWVMREPALGLPSYLLMGCLDALARVFVHVKQHDEARAEVALAELLYQLPPACRSQAVTHVREYSRGLAERGAAPPLPAVRIDAAGP
ncbi:hypothetical protein GT347_22730 [Xylophilus rhododendri]|uniref:Uncharacterized protein n=1 Tax=Xylophilus rhododendri TaxID=2697032 RepID=A0A857JC59_9BURK|nr:hypothetical protein [Xylophilus rhododendri]QHJ00543.1 hypothetical protein GT347_22730 [Xylophilus rhododendri]